MDNKRILLYLQHCYAVCMHENNKRLDDLRVNDWQSYIARCYFQPKPCKALMSLARFGLKYKVLSMRLVLSPLFFEVDSGISRGKVPPFATTSLTFLCRFMAFTDPILHEFEESFDSPPLKLMTYTYKANPLDIQLLQCLTDLLHQVGSHSLVIGDMSKALKICQLNVEVSIFLRKVF